MNSMAASPQATLESHDGYHCDFNARKAVVLNTIAELGTPGCALRAPLSLIDLYQHHEPDLSSSLTPWALAVFELEREGLIRTMPRNQQLYMQLTDAGMKRVFGLSEKPTFTAETRRRRESPRKGRAA